MLFTRLERPKCAKDKVKQAQMAQRCPGLVGLGSRVGGSGGSGRAASIYFRYFWQGLQLETQNCWQSASPCPNHLVPRSVRFSVMLVHYKLEFTPLLNLEVKLVGGKNEWEGNILVRSSGKELSWPGKPVCDDGIKTGRPTGTATAKVVCRFFSLVIKI